jgi:transposase
LSFDQAKEGNMTDQTQQCESTAVCLYVALELSAQEWLLTMTTALSAGRVRARVAPKAWRTLPEVFARAKRQLGVPAATPVRSGHEAGREGFWPHRCLTQLGVRNVVVDSSSIEVNRRARQAKTDRLDGEHLVRLLIRYWSGERRVWHVVQVPARDQEDARQASRGLTALQEARTRYRNQIQGLLTTHGVVARVRLDGKFAERLARTVDWAGEPLPPGVHQRVLQTWRLLEAVETERAMARRAERAAARPPAPGTAPTPIQHVAQLRGVAARSATVLTTELFWRDLHNGREVGALTGLVPTPYRSGTLVHERGVAPGGIAAVRRLAVDLAWGWIRYQPTSALTRWYARRFGHGGAVTRRIGIVAVARKLVIALWRYVSQGILPEGALLKG